VAYTFACSLGFTGIAIHEWLGIGLGVVLLVHLTLHWDWVIRTTRKLVSGGGRERFVWLVNLLLLVSMTLCIASGILISQVALPGLGITLPASSFWRQMHGTTATLTLILVPVHAALRWRWIAGVARRLASGAVTVRFVRHLTAVVLAVAVIVGLGMLWAHACGGTGSGSGLRRAPSRAALLRLEQVKAGVIRVHPGNGFHLADTGDLIRTCVIEAVLATVVITVSAVRRHRRGRRTAAARA
jgi:Domain of unknown function (DUF4405)